MRLDKILLNSWKHALIVGGAVSLCYGLGRFDDSVISNSNPYIVDVQVQKEAEFYTKFGLTAFGVGIVWAGFTRNKKSEDTSD